MSSFRLERLAPLTGVVFAVIFYAAVFGSGDTPDADAGPAKAVKYWSDNDTKQIAFAIAGVIATVFFVWFAGALRARLLEAEGGSGRLTSTMYAGAVLFAAGLLANLGITFTVADTAGDLTPAATQTLSALSSDFFFPLVGGGAILYLAFAVATLRTRAFPRWLGWVTLVLGVVCFTPVGWVPFLLLGLWTAVVAVLLYRAGAVVAAAAEPTPPPASPVIQPGR
jgi:hypothetical protein